MMRLVPALALVLSACSPLPGLDPPPPTGPPAVAAAAPTPASAPAAQAARRPPAAVQAADDAESGEPAPPPPATPAPAPAPAAGAAEDLDSICKQTECRPAHTLKLHLDDGRAVDVPVPSLPYVHRDIVHALPGDDFYVAADERGGRLVNMRYVAPPATPKDALHIRFRQEQIKGGHWMMVAHITSHFSHTLAYHAATQGSPSRPSRRTSVCPLHPGAGVFESWPNAILFLHLKDFRVVDPKSEDGRVCK